MPTSSKMAYVSKKEGGSAGKCPYCGKEMVKHIIKEGARYHVTIWYKGENGGLSHCSEPNCENNHGPGHCVPFEADPFHGLSHEERIKKLFDQTCKDKREFPPKYKNENAYTEDLMAILTIVFVAALGMLCLFSFLCPLWTQEHNVTIFVKEKIPYHDGKYLIVADVDGHEKVFTVGDDWVLLKFDASDRYAYLKENKSYVVDTCGYRFQFFSWYQNIYHIYGM